MTDQSHPGGSTARSVAATKGFFPDQNPNPVLRLESDGRLRYAHAAAAPIVAAWQVAVGSSSIPSPSKRFERPPERRHRIGSRSSTSSG